MAREDERVWVIRETCPDCRNRLVVRHNRTTGEPFISCSGWKPKGGCSFTEPYDAQTQRLMEEVARLEDANKLLRDGSAVLRRELHAAQATDPKALANEIRSVMVALHPDKNPEGLDANRVVAELSGLRDRVLAARGTH